MKLTQEQERILTSDKKRVVVSASAGSGKTFVLVEKLITLIRDRKIPVSRLLVLTFTKAAAKEMKSRLYAAMLEQKPDEFLLEQIDDISISDISTIDSFCEKIIKRNISKIDLDEGFAILDEQSILALKKRAFQSAFEKFSRQKDEFETIYFAFKRNKERVEECIFEMQSYFDARSSEKVANEFLENEKVLQQNSYKFLQDFVVEKICMAKTLLSKAQTFVEIPEKSMQFAEILLKQLSALNFDGQSFYQICDSLNNLQVADLPRAKCDADFKKLIARAKELVKEAQATAENYKGISVEDIDEIEKNSLSKALLRFYIVYQEKYSLLKKARNALDFADIERYAQRLLKDEEIKKNLQSKYDYIFIDEYQDTNRLQESILKPIAEGGFFTAVGDIKQGIYGFRNASKEIMLQDIQDYDAADDGQALYLNGNFRTDDNILSFVNDVFVSIMTEKSAGIDYKNKSMLVGLKEFKRDSLPPVSIDIVSSETGKEEKTVRKGVYSVKEDEIVQDEKYKLEIATIEARIDEALGQEIYDAKLGSFRKTNQSDIALLFRNRSALMKECVKHLQAKGYSVEADIKNSLLEDGQIRVVNALLKLTLNKQDDISMAAVMSSPIGGFSLQELSNIRMANPDKCFWEIVTDSSEKKLKNFVDMIDKFSFNIQVYGIIKALQMILNEKGLYQYIKLLPDRNEKFAHINELFKMIRACDFDFKPSSVVSFLEQNSKQKSANEGSVDAITATTIHATKGLEYPIVILCGCGENLSKVYNKNYALSSEFGLGTHVYNLEEDKSFLSPSFLAGKLKKMKDEFESELMIFYVALTRAQNHLYIIGSGKEKNFSFDDIEKQHSYLKLIMYALGEGITCQLFEQGEIKTHNRRLTVVTEIEKDELDEIKNIKNNNLQKYQEKINKYHEFIYKNQKNCKLNYKNSVTGVLKLEEDDIFVKEYNISEENSVKIKNAVDSGNAYHEALKFVDFDKVENIRDLENQLSDIKKYIKEEYCDLIDKNILYKNIITIKSLLNNQRVFKEQEFLMKCPLSQLGMSQEGDDEVIVQGIVDFFALGEKNILIDYKYTSTQDEEKLKKRYGKQIELYRLAIEKAFGKTIDEQYLLSLKHSKLIKL